MDHKLWFLIFDLFEKLAHQNDACKYFLVKLALAHAFKAVYFERYFYQNDHSSPSLSGQKWPK